MIDDCRTYLVDYGHGGKLWVMEVKAESEKDAMSRIRAAAANGHVAGELQMVIPAAPGAGLLTRFLCWWKNL